MATRRMDTSVKRRHGLMLVGPTGGGKSRNLHVLEDTLGQLKVLGEQGFAYEKVKICLLYTSPSPRDQRGSRMPSSA